MAQDAAPPYDPRTPGRSRQNKRPAKKQAAIRTNRQKTAPSLPNSPHECLIIGEFGDCPDWQEILVRYPLIDSVQREDFPEHGASFVYLAHFYRTRELAKERSCAQKQFRNFFRSIGYTFDSAGDFKSRWFEGIGIRTRTDAIDARPA